MLSPSWFGSHYRRRQATQYSKSRGYRAGGRGRRAARGCTAGLKMRAPWWMGEHRGRFNNGRFMNNNRGHMMNGNAWCFFGFLVAGSKLENCANKCRTIVIQNESVLFPVLLPHNESGPEIALLD